MLTRFYSNKFCVEVCIEVCGCDYLLLEALDALVLFKEVFGALMVRSQTKIERKKGEKLTILPITVVGSLLEL